MFESSVLSSDLKASAIHVGSDSAYFHTLTFSNILIYDLIVR